MTMDILPAGHAMPRGLALLRQFLAVIGRAELMLAIVALIVVVALSATQAFLRYVGGWSLWWAQEVAECTILVTYFLGISYVFKTRQEIYIEFVAMLTPMRVQILMFIVEQVVSMIFALALLWLIGLFLPVMLNMQTPLLKMPGWLPFAPLIFSTVMIGLTSLYYCAFGIWSLNRSSAATSLAEIEAPGLILRPWEVQL